jgi:hypothetical protein
MTPQQTSLKSSFVRADRDLCQQRFGLRENALNGSLLEIRRISERSQDPL